MKPNEIKAARIRLGISAHEMAQALNISDDAYHRRERGEIQFKTGEVPILISKLQLTLQQASDFLFDGKLPVG